MRAEEEARRKKKRKVRTEQREAANRKKDIPVKPAELRWLVPVAGAAAVVLL